MNDTHFQVLSPWRQALALTLGLWAVLAVLILLPVLIVGQPPRPAMLINIGSTLLIGLAASALLYRAAGVLVRKPPVVRGSVIFVLVLVLAGLIALIDAAKDSALMAYFQPEVPQRSILLGASSNLILFALLMAFSAALYLVLHGHTQLQERERELADARAATARAELTAAQAETAAADARLAALRYQINPHFLFNTLNAISSMVVTGRSDAAEGMLTKLSDFLRTTLSARPDALVPLEDELASIADYLEIESLRLRDRLVVEVDCPPELLDVSVPSFLLQPLIENAIKHGVAPTSRTVTVSVRACRAGMGILGIDVADNGGGGASPAQGLGLGLNNVRERLRTVYGGDATLESEQLSPGFRARITMPMAATAMPGRSAA